MDNMNFATIIAARRTAVMPRDGAFSGCEIHHLAGPVIQAALHDAGLSCADVGELIVSNALGAGGNPARSIALGAGLPAHVAGLSIDRQCAGGMDALLLARAMVLSGQHDVVVAGGAESYSRRPLRYRSFADGRAPEFYDQAAFTPWGETDPNMAEAAAALAIQLDISKEEQDQWAIRSHEKAMAWNDHGKAPEIVDLLGHAQDGFPRKLSEKLCARARVVVGSITAANMAVAADGAAFCVVVSAQVAQRLAQKSTNKKSTNRGVDILAGTTLGADPMMPGLAPVGAIKATLAFANLKPDQITSAEIMEAFAVQAIACQTQTMIDPKRVNQKGGALARGHPIGASGAILATRLFHDLCSAQSTGEQAVGLGAIASAGGLGSCILLRVR